MRRAVEEVGLRQVDQGVDPDKGDEQHQDEARPEHGCVKGDVRHGQVTRGEVRLLSQEALGGDPVERHQALQQDGAQDEDRPGDQQG